MTLQRGGEQEGGKEHGSGGDEVISRYFVIGVGARFVVWKCLICNTARASH